MKWVMSVVPYFSQAVVVTSRANSVGERGA